MSILSSPPNNPPTGISEPIPDEVFLLDPAHKSYPVITQTAKPGQFIIGTVLTVFFLPFIIGAGIFLLVWFLGGLRDYVEMTNAGVHGTATITAINPGTDRENPAFTLVYQYVVNDHVYIGITGTGSPTNTQMGDKLAILYNRNNPEQVYVGDGPGLGTPMMIGVFCLMYNSLMINFGLSILIRLSKSRRRKSIYAKGTLLKGEVLNAKIYTIKHDKSPVIHYLLVNYSFISPNGTALSGQDEYQRNDLGEAINKQTSEQLRAETGADGGDTLGGKLRQVHKAFTVGAEVKKRVETQVLPPPGTPVRVVYVDDQQYAML